MISSRQHALVLGLGHSGLAAAELALRNGCAVTVLDERENADLGERGKRLTNRGVKVILGAGEAKVPEADFAVISPGIGPGSGLWQLAGQLNCPILSELEYGYRSCACPILAITGTNGKTTTTELTVHALRHAGLKALAAGNIGLPLSEAALRSGSLDYLVVEVSSFQLERVHLFAPLTAAFLNFSPDHLDRHPDLDDYARQKVKIFDRLSAPHRAIIGDEVRNLPAVAAHPLFARGKATTFTTQSGVESDFGMTADGSLYAPDGAGGSSVFAQRSGIKLIGAHNMANVLAATALCRQVGIAAETVAASLASYAPAAHRLELVAVRDGVRYVNDSKATNPDALCQALLACSGNSGEPTIHLIAGGVDKQLDFHGITPIVARCVRSAYLIGACRDTLHQLWHPHISCQNFSSLAAAVREAVDNANSGDTVLLSPGCASFDMFRDYADRGTAFTQEIHRSIGA